jgi:hypothetical protein
MRRAAILAAVLITASTASAADIKTGRDLVNACRNYIAAATVIDNNVRRPHACRTFLQGFAVALKTQEDARLDAMVRGLPYTAKEQCVRMPDFISFRELAQRIVNFGTQNPRLLEVPAATLAQKTLERDFPCPPAANQPRR